MIAVSLATRRRVPSTIGLIMLRLHTPEPLRPRALLSEARAPEGRLLGIPPQGRPS